MVLRTMTAAVGAGVLWPLRVDLWPLGSLLWISAVVGLQITLWFKGRRAVVPSWLAFLEAILPFVALVFGLLIGLMAAPSFFHYLLVTVLVGVIGLQFLLDD